MVSAVIEDQFYNIMQTLADLHHSIWLLVLDYQTQHPLLPLDYKSVLGVLLGWVYHFCICVTGFPTDDLELRHRVEELIRRGRAFMQSLDDMTWELYRMYTLFERRAESNGFNQWTFEDREKIRFVVGNSVGMVFDS